MEDCPLCVDVPIDIKIFKMAVITMVTNQMLRYKAILLNKISCNLIRIIFRPIRISWAQKIGIGLQHFEFFSL
jgi:hypothetical protein